MHTAAPQIVHAPPQSATPRLVAPRGCVLAWARRPIWGNVFEDAVPMIDAPAFYGPPVVFVLGPWLLMVLLLAGPFALFLMVLLALAAAAGLMAVFVAMIASPYLLIRRLHSRRTAREKRRARRHRSRTDRIAAGRFGLPQAKSVP